MSSLVEALVSRDGKANLRHGEAITDGMDYPVMIEDKDYCGLGVKQL